MKHYTLYIMLLSALLLSACSDKDEPLPITGADEAYAIVSVGVDGIAGTKALKSETALGTEPGSEAENEIYNLNVVFIDEAKNEVMAHAYREIDDKQDTIRVGLKTGAYRMLVIANVGNISSFDPQTYYDQIATLADQGGKNGFVMTNIPEVKEIDKGKNDIKATVKRVVGRVELSKLSVEWKDNDLQAIEGLEFHLSQVFLANVRPTSHFFDVPVGEAGASMEIKKEYLSGIKDYKVDGDIAKGSSFADYLRKEFTDYIVKKGDDTHTDLAQFYAMTNSDTKDVGKYPVILYIKGSIYDSEKGKYLLENRYYRIKLAKGVKRNTIYKIEATIQGKGSPEPGDNKENADMSITIITKTWDEVTLDTITIEGEIEI